MFRTASPPGLSQVNCLDGKIRKREGQLLALSGKKNNHGQPRALANLPRGQTSPRVRSWHSWKRGFTSDAKPPTNRFTSSSWVSVITSLARLFAPRIDGLSLPINIG